MTIMITKMMDQFANLGPTIVVGENIEQVKTGSEFDELDMDLKSKADIKKKYVSPYFKSICFNYYRNIVFMIFTNINKKCLQRSKLFFEPIIMYICVNNTGSVRTQ